MKRIFINKLLVLLVLFLGSYTIIAQNKDIPTKELTARILDTNNQPLTNVIVKSFIANEKALTDNEGNFTIKVAAAVLDHLYVEEAGFKPLVIEVDAGELKENNLVLKNEYLYEGDKKLSFPYQVLSSNRSVSATTVIKGEELGAYPTTTFLEALSGRVPGMVVSHAEAVISLGSLSSSPGQESASVSIRGVSATIYVDGILRDPSDLAINEVDEVHIIRDMAGRAMLGLSGTNPVIYITTKKGTKFKRQISASTSFGISAPMALPKYLDAFDYATLFNEARENDGLSARYSAEAIQAYKDNSNPIKYPNVDYQDEYVKKQSMYRKANLNFSGGDHRVSYFSMLDYTGTDGLEAVGEETKYNRYKIRGNVNIKLNDWIKMNVQLSAVYSTNRYANLGSGSGYLNPLYYISRYPANAHPIMFDDKLIISDDYPINLTNELLYGGYAENVELNTQNSAELEIDMGSILEGLTFKSAAAFDVYNSITNNKGGTADLYRIIDNNGELGTERIVEEVIQPNLSSGANTYMRRTSVSGLFTYDQTFDEHALTLNASYFQLLEEIRNTDRNYQPLKRQDLGFRANYAYDNRYVAQFDMSYTGSMILMDDERFKLYPTIGAGWIISNEDFFSDNKLFDYLKLYSSYGQSGIEYVGLGGFNQYYLFETLWSQAGQWQSGTEGNKATPVNIYNILQPGSNDYELPTLNFLNIGMQSRLLDNHLAFELNYYSRTEKNYFSTKPNQVPSLFGGPEFLPASNFGERKYWGLDALLQYNNSIGKLNYTLGANAMYNRGKIVEIDEPVALEDYRKRSNTEADHFWGYESAGLFQSDAEVASNDVAQSWGAVQPGDIKYVDINNDKVVDEKDIHDLDEHTPRISYALNLSLEYEGFGLKMIGTGMADGKMYLNMSYFGVRGSNQNYSKPMLDRWPVTNDYPRLTTQSVNNYQPSTFWLANAAYFTLKNVELSYTLPRKVAKKILMSDCKLFAQGRNIFTVSELSKYGLNPEDQYAGILSYPMLRTITFGVACKF